MITRSDPWPSRNKYGPDFLVRLINGKMLVLEARRQNTEEDNVKWEFLGRMGAGGQYPRGLRPLLLRRVVSAQGNRRGSGEGCRACAYQRRVVMKMNSRGIFGNRCRAKAS